MTLGETGIETSAIGLGCADLYRLDRAERRRLLDTALAAGLVHLDVAPMYGLGSVEGEVGRLVRGRRDGLVLATKFGIDPSPAARLLSVAQGALVRAGAGRSGSGDARAGAAGSLLYRSSYRPSSARRSIVRSLRALRTDHVDLLFVHDPPTAEVDAELRGELEAMRSEGLLRAWGVAGPAGAGAVDVPLRQAPGDIFSRDAIRPGPPTLLYGVIGRALQRVLAHVRGDAATGRLWSDALGPNAADADAISSLLLRDALEFASGSPVLVGSTRPERLEAAAAAAARPPGPELDVFRRLVGEVRA